MEKQSVFNDKTIVGSPTVHLISMFILLFVFWMILSGRSETKFIVYGVLTAAVTSWITYPLLLVNNKDKTKKYFVFGVNPIKLLSYFCWGMWQLILANVDVLLATTSQEMAIDPKIVRFYYRNDNPMAIVMLANSITLTPGTVTINVEDDGLFEIHALTKAAAEGVMNDTTAQKVSYLFDSECDYELVGIVEEDV